MRFVMFLGDDVVFGSPVEDFRRLVWASKVTTVEYGALVLCGAICVGMSIAGAINPVVGVFIAVSLVVSMVMTHSFGGMRLNAFHVLKSHGISRRVVFTRPSFVWVVVAVLVIAGVPGGEDLRVGVADAEGGYARVRRRASEFARMWAEGKLSDGEFLAMVNGDASPDSVPPGFSGWSASDRALFMLGMSLMRARAFGFSKLFFGRPGEYLISHMYSGVIMLLGVILWVFPGSEQWLVVVSVLLSAGVFLLGKWREGHLSDVARVEYCGVRPSFVSDMAIVGRMRDLRYVPVVGGVSLEEVAPGLADVVFEKFLAVYGAGRKSGS